MVIRTILFTAFTGLAGTVVLAAAAWQRWAARAAR